jgi:ADP-ribose pyrophosphatase YjhB (NUDIX family)
MVLVLMYDRNDRLYLRKRGNERLTRNRWDIGRGTFLRPGESAMDGAYREIQGCMGLQAGKLRFICTLPPLTTERAFVSLYRLNNCDIACMDEETDTILKVDHDELSGLVAHCPELLADRVVSLWKQRRLFDAF